MKNTKKNALPCNVKARIKYNKEHYDHYDLRLDKGVKEKLKEFCKEHGYSLNEFIVKAIEEKKESLF